MLTRLQRQFMGLLGARRIPQGGGGAAMPPPAPNQAAAPAAPPAQPQGQQGQGQQAPAPQGQNQQAAPPQGQQGQQNQGGQQGQGQQAQQPPPRPLPANLAECKERRRELKMRKGKILTHPDGGQNALAAVVQKEALLPQPNSTDLNQWQTRLDDLEQEIQTAEAAVASAWNATLGNTVTALNTLGTQPAAAWVPAGALPQGYTPPNIKGSGAARWFGSKGLAEMSFGGHDERRDVEARKKEIDWLRKTGEAVEVNVTNPDGDRLNGNFYSAKSHNLKNPAHNGRPDTSKPVVLLLTGSGGSAEEQGYDMARFYTEQDASVLSVNYRGFGGSDDAAPSEKGLVEDAQAMLEFLLKTGYTMDMIVIHGFSLGAGVAAALEAANTEANPQGGFNIRGAVADRPMTSVYDAALAHGKGMVEGVLGKPGATLLHPVASIGAKLGKSATGAFDTKKNLKAADKLNEDANLPAVDRVVTSDVEQLGPAAEKLRDARQAAGQSTGAEHLDSRAMLEANRNELAAVLHPNGVPNATPDPLSVANHDEVAARLEADFRRCVAFTDKGAGLFNRLRQAPDRKMTERLLLRAQEFRQLIAEMEASNYLNTVMRDRIDPTGVLNNSKAVLDFLLNAQSGLPSILAGIAGAGQGAASPPAEAPAVTTIQIQMTVSQETANLKADLAGLFPAPTFPAAKKQASKAGKALAKQFGVVAERVERFAADSQPGANKTLDELAEELHEVQNAIAAFDRLYEAKGYGPASLGPPAVQALRRECNTYDAWIGARLARCNNLKLLHGLSGGTVTNQTLQNDPILLARLENAAWAGNEVDPEVRKAARKYLADYQEDAEEAGRDGFAEAVDAAREIKDRWAKMSDLKQKAGAALTNADRRVPFWHFPRMADGRPLVVPGVMRTQAEACAAGGTAPTLVRISMKKTRKGPKIIYDGALGAADLLKAMNSTAFNTAGLVPGVTLKPKPPAPQPAGAGQQG